MIDRLRADYRAMRGMIFGAPPPFEAVLDSVSSLAALDGYHTWEELNWASLVNKIADLDAVRAVPEKPGKEKAPAKPSPEPSSPVAKTELLEKVAGDPSKGPGSRPSPRKTPLEPSPRPIESVRPTAEPPNRDPSFLPGI